MLESPAARQPRARGRPTRAHPLQSRTSNLEPRTSNLEPRTSNLLQQVGEREADLRDEHHSIHVRPRDVVLFDGQTLRRAASGSRRRRRRRSSRAESACSSTKLPVSTPVARAERDHQERHRRTTARSSRPRASRRRRSAASGSRRGRPLPCPRNPWSSTPRAGRDRKSRRYTTARRPNIVFTDDQPATFRSTPRGIAIVMFAQMPSRFVRNGGTEYTTVIAVATATIQKHSWRPPGRDEPRQDEGDGIRRPREQPGVAQAPGVRTGAGAWACSRDRSRGRRSGSGVGRRHSASRP